ncbi:MAG TPA: hypothetical protein VMT85_23165 [Thermoanaerobaculia bacterium]|nr:hypothetical protein [Thermoanaerobaculia bacterium]
MKMPSSASLAGILALGAAAVSSAAPSAVQSEDGIPRTAAGRPDLSGTYDVSTLTPLQRPREFGENLYLTPEQADAIVEEERQRVLDRERNRGPADEPPPPGGAPPIGIGDEFRESSGAGNVGGYNNFWTDRGSDVFMVDGKFRTSIIVDPENGRHPPMTEEAIGRLSERSSLRRPNDGTAWWLGVLDHGPYDGPEDLGIAERCILGFTGAAPTYPSLYNNHKRIVQTEDHVMILIEMVHDARIVRMESEHPPADRRFWLGDSIGWWEGDTLVVDTTNFHPLAGMRGGSESMHVIERFSRLEDGNLLYRFTVEDPTVWTEPWTGEYVWRTSDENVYEYACHEGNYAMEGILRGARLLEAEALERSVASGSSADQE